MIVNMSEARGKLAGIYYRIESDRYKDRSFIALCHSKAGDRKEHDINGYKFELSALFKERTKFRELDSDFLKQIWECLFSKERRA